MLESEALQERAEFVGMVWRSVRPDQRVCAQRTLPSKYPSGDVRTSDENVLRAHVANQLSRFGLDNVDDSEHWMEDSLFTRFKKWKCFASVSIVLRQLSEERESWKTHQSANSTLSTLSPTIPKPAVARLEPRKRNRRPRHVIPCPQLWNLWRWRPTSAWYYRLWGRRCRVCADAANQPMVKVPLEKQELKTPTTAWGEWSGTWVHWCSHACVVSVMLVLNVACQSGSNVQIVLVAKNVSQEGGESRVGPWHYHGTTALSWPPLCQSPGWRVVVTMLLASTVSVPAQ